MRRRWLVGMLALMPGGTAFGQASDMRSFRQQVLGILNQKYAHLQPKAGDEDSTIEVDNGSKSGVIDLTNIYGKVRQVPVAQQEAEIVDYLGKMLKGFDAEDDKSRSSWAAMSKLLRPRLVSSTLRLPLPTMLQRPFATGARHAYVLDHDDHVEYVQRDMLQPWGVDLEQVHKTAVANLEELTEVLDIEMRQAKGNGRFIGVVYGDSYDAARLVLPDFRRRLLEMLGEPFFAGIPHRDLLLAWSSDVRQQSLFVGKIAADFKQSPYPITDAIFHVDRKGVGSAKG